MVRPEKVAVVDEIKDKLQNSGAVFITEYRGLTVAQQQELRRSLSASGTEYKVMKMSLARLAAEGAGQSDLLELLQGPTALAFTDGDPVVAAKELKTFSKRNEFLVIKGGLVEGETLDQEAFSKLADLEPREVLLAMFAGALKAPLTKLAGLMNAVLRQPASVMQQLLEKKEADAPAEEGAAGEPVAEDSAEEEPAAEETPAEEEGVAGEDTAAEEASTEESAEEAAGEMEEPPADEAPDESADAAAEESATEEDTQEGSEDEESESEESESEDSEDEDSEDEE